MNRASAQKNEVSEGLAAAAALLEAPSAVSASAGDVAEGGETSMDALARGPEVEMTLPDKPLSPPNSAKAKLHFWREKEKKTDDRVTMSLTSPSGSTPSPSPKSATQGGVGLRDGRIRVSVSHKGRQVELDQLRFVQCLGPAHKGQINCMALSAEGMFLATGGKDGFVIIWRVLQFDKEAYEQMEPQSPCNNFSQNVRPHGPKFFSSDPWSTFHDHKDEITDLCWSKSQFLLSSSSDATVRLWHVQRNYCLYVFKHREAVTCVDFDPNNDSSFVCGSVDKILRVWGIKEGRVQHWEKLTGVITAVVFDSESKMIVAGMEEGEVRFFFKKDAGLSFFTQIECRNRRGIQRRGRPVTGMQRCQTSSNGATKQALLITTQDSRVRLCSLEAYISTCKFKGATITTLPISAKMTASSAHIIAGSEDRHVYLWAMSGLEPDLKGTTTKKQKFLGNVAKKNGSFECFQAHGNSVTCAEVAPSRGLKFSRNRKISSSSTSMEGAVIVTAGSNGHIHVFENASTDEEVGNTPSPT